MENPNTGEKPMAMRIDILVLLSALATGGATAASLPAEVVEHLDQSRVVLYLSDSQIDAMPSWQPGEGAPPMSLETAVKRVQAWSESNALYKGARIHELKYKPVHNYESRNRWYFLVELLAPNAKRRFVAVLPDGEVVPAIEEPGR